MQAPSPHVISTAFILRANPDITRGQLKHALSNHLDLVVYRSTSLWLSTARFRECFPGWYAKCVALLEKENATKGAA